MTRRVKITASILVVLPACAAVAAAQLTATGDANAIAFDRAVVAQANRAPGFSATQQGLLTMRSRQSGNVRSFELSWGAAVIKPRWTAVAERLTFAQFGGVTTWITDNLTPICTRASDCKGNLPAEVLTDFYGVYVRFEPSRGSCFYLFPGLRTPYPGTGTPWWSVGGDFLGPPRRRGADTVIEYTYRFGKTQVAQEIDTVVTRTKVLRSGVVRVANGTRARPPWAFTFSAHFTRLQKTPSMPRLTLCP